MRTLALALGALVGLAAAAHALVLDADGDGIPDGAESNACGRRAVEFVVDALDPVGGSCAGLADYRPPDAAGNLADGDGDAVPDGFEPVVCRLEDRNDPLDGSCEGGDYLPPS